MGYTVDDEFVDDTPGDSFPFLAMQIYMSASYDFDMINVHGSLGMFLSSESVQSDNRFDLPIQAGASVSYRRGWEDPPHARPPRARDAPIHAGPIPSAGPARSPEQPQLDAPPKT